MQSCGSASGIATPTDAEAHAMLLDIAIAKQAAVVTTAVVTTAGFADALPWRVFMNERER